MRFTYYSNYFFWILFLVFFSSSYVFFRSPFEFYFHYLIFLILFPLLLLKFGIPKFYFQIFSLPLIVGIVYLSFENNLPFTFIKVFGGLSLTILFFYYVIVFFEFDLFKLFEFYCNCCWIIVIIAILQVFFYLLNFEPGYNFNWIFNKWGFVKGGIVGFRVNSILSEPTFLATSISPAVYVSVKNLISKQNFIYNKIQSVLILLTAVFTTSTIGFLGILLSVLLVTKTIRLRYVVIAFFISLAGFSVAYKNVIDFKSRVDAAKGLWFENDFRIRNTNNSSFVLYNNLHIAKESLKKYPIFGTGLGSHETAFKKFTLTKSLIQYDFEFNIKDGNSLFIRLCTETGLVGLSFVILLIIRGFIYKVDDQNDFLLKREIISQSIFVLLILVLIRQGNYMLNGLPFLFLLYYYNGVQYKNELSNLNTDD